MFKTITLAIASLLLTVSVYGEETTREQVKGLDEQIQEIKSDVIGIAAELSQLEEKLLYPSDTQVAIFISLGESEEFRLDSVSIALDGAPAAHHLYTFKELDALRRGGVQRIHTGNLRRGAHELQVDCLGKTAGGSEFRMSERFAIDKGIGPEIVEIALTRQTIELRQE